MKNFALLSLTLLFFFQVNAQTWIEKSKLTLTLLNGNIAYGGSYEMDGNFAIIGNSADHFDVMGQDSTKYAGSAFFMELDANGNWNQVQKVVASDRDSLDNFGRTVGISGNYAVVSTPFEQGDISGGNPLTRAGAAYIFERNASGVWVEVQKIVSSDRKANHEFGSNIAISGNYIIAGVSREEADTSGGNNLWTAGAAYIFERDNTTGTWSEVQKIVASDRVSNLLFGWSVDMSGDYAIIGAIGNTESAYIFEKDGSGTWIEVQKIEGSGSSTIKEFGGSVSIDGNRAIVGAALDENGAGAAYIFERDNSGNWNNVKRVVSADMIVGPGEHFGVSVSIDNDYAVIGADYDDEDASGGNFISRAGSAYILKQDGTGNWGHFQKIVASDRGDNHHFGWNLHIYNKHLIVSSFVATYLFELSPGLSITQNNFGPALHAFPNPTTGKLSIDLGESYSNINITVRNTIGQTVLTQAFDSADQFEIEIKGPAGMYFVEVQTEEGKAAVLKVVKR